MSELSLRGKNLTQLEADILADNLHVSKLDLTENSFKDFQFLKKFTNLKTLVLDNNNIKTLKLFPQLPTVDTLWLNNNKISDVRKLMDHISRLFPNITYLSLLRNPCTPDMYFSDDEADSYQRWRYYVIHRLPTLSMLDASPVDDDELDKAKKVGATMIAARPDGDDSDDDDDNNNNDKTQQSTKTNNELYSVSNLIRQQQEPKVTTFLVRSKPRYDGSNSEGNRFITNDDL